MDGLLFLLQAYVLAALATLFFPLFGVLHAWLAPIVPPPPGEKKRRFAILIPAHDEERVLPRLLESIEKQDYPFFETFVVADNCGDDTAGVARKSGVLVFERATHQPSTKSQALRFLWGSIENRERFDAVLILDADNVIPACFLALVDAELCAGTQVVQGMRRPKNPFVSRSSSLDYLSEAVSHRIGGVGRRALGLSGTIAGSGVVYRRGVFEELLNEAKDTLVEDCEWQLLLMLSGIGIVFSPWAMVYDEKTDNFRDLTVQRSRWISGKYRLIPRYFPRFLRRGNLDGLLYLLSIPPRSTFLAANLTFAVLALFSQAGIWPFWPLILLFWPVYLLVGMVLEGASLKAYVAILFLPAWVLRLLWASLLALRPCIWTPTVHRHDMMGDE